MKAAGTRVAYDHEAQLWKDKVEIPGPTKQILKIKVSGTKALSPVKTTWLWSNVSY